MGLRGVVSGYPDGSILPLNLINRAELSKILYECTIPDTQAVVNEDGILNPEITDSSIEAVVGDNSSTTNANGNKLYTFDPAEKEDKYYAISIAQNGIGPVVYKEEKVGDETIYQRIFPTSANYYLIKTGTKVIIVAMGTASTSFTMDIEMLDNTLDMDGDGLFDVWELTGDINFDGIIDIHNADPEKTDVYVEINWMTGFKPAQDSLDIVKDSFANSGAGYGNKGINLHNVWGKEHPHIANITLSDATIDTVIKSYFTDSTETTPILQYAYHCALFGDKYNGGNSSGMAAASRSSAIRCYGL